MLTLFAVGSGLEAKHIIGGEVTYECLGPGAGNNTRSFKITMKIYRDCDPTAGGADFDMPAYFSIYRGTENSNTLFKTITLNNVLVTNIIPDTPACIQNVPYVCVQQGIYMFTVDLPESMTDSYFVVYQRCCRNNSISHSFNNCLIWKRKFK